MPFSTPQIAGFSRRGAGFPAVSTGELFLIVSSLGRSRGCGSIFCLCAGGCILLAQGLFLIFCTFCGKKVDF